MLITDYLKEECIDISLSGENREEVIKKLLDLILKSDPGINREEALEDLFAREKLESTAIGKGVAIPHARVEKTSGIKVAFGLLKNGLGFDSIDNKPVELVFLILFPKDEVGLQLRFLARVARVLQQSGLHDSLLACKSAKEVVDIFKIYEEKHFH
jgi:mannitol/fructose-specific phosphotransferase system IIA component (Ntr-type)